MVQFTQRPVVFFVLNAFVGWTACLAALTLGCSGNSQSGSTSRTASIEVSSSAGSPDKNSTRQPEPNAAEKQAFVDRLRPQVEGFCGNCHMTPRPESVDKHRWPREVLQGFEFHRVSGVERTNMPSVDDTTKFFVYQAPEILEMPESIVGNPVARVKFQNTRIVKQVSQTSESQPPCVSQLTWVDLDGDGKKSLVYCELGTGSVFQFQPTVDDTPRLLAVLYQPTSLAPVDLDNDGNLDLIVADLGEFLAADSEFGRVVWLRKRPDGEGYEKVTLKDGLGRVADVESADFDGDGDFDILVAEFGWRTSGRILLFEQTHVDDKHMPNFNMREIDPRHGAIEVPLVDLNGDGNLDFVALISQEHEVVEAFINDGNGRFSIETIYRANDPIYGSSRIELVDVDGDGDEDVVYANGDSFDSGSKPYHSVQWLENQGAYPFEHHHISYMPGVLSIKAADFDGDGDIDIVAGALMPEPANEQLEARGVESLILLEQTSLRVFRRTKLETSTYQNASIEVGDFDGDGRIDIAVGNFLHFQPHLPTRQDFTIWRNLGLQ